MTTEMKPPMPRMPSDRSSSPSRRGFLTTLAAGAGAMLLGDASGAETNVSVGPNGIIDIHSHLTPPNWAAELARTNRLTAGVKDWTPARMIEDMDQGGVAASITSMTTPGFIGMDRELAKRLAREGNDFAARLMADHKGRFGMFTNLPMPDIDATLREIEYGMDTLKADGVSLLTNVGDKWLSDPIFAPVFEELNRRKAVVYTHPTGANCCRNLIKGVPDAAIEYETDTTRVISQMIFNGSSQRYPDIRMIFSHAGGTMPYLVGRLIFVAKTQYAKELPQGFEAEAAKYFYDTAQSFSPSTMGALKRVVPMSQIVFGTDYPFRTTAEHVKGLKECGTFSPKELHAIYHDNPLRILPRFRS